MKLVDNLLLHHDLAAVHLAGSFSVQIVATRAQFTLAAG